jgi:PAS domain S-box-containing protein
MKQESDRFTTVSIICASIFACFVVAALIAAEYHAFPTMSAPHFNPYGLISLFSAIGSAIVLLRMAFRGSHSEEAVWFMLIAFGDLVFAGAEAMQRFSQSNDLALFWSQISGAGVQLFGVGIFLFAIAYTRPAGDRPAFLTPLFLTVTVFVSMFYATGALIYGNDPAKLVLYPWGLNNDPGVASWVSIIWIVLPGLVGGFILLRFRKKTDHILLKKQSLLFAIAILFPVITGTITDGVLPILHFDSVPPLASLFELATTVIIFYGMSRYQFFQINPAVLAENVLTTMHEAVVVTREDFTVEYVNKEAERLLNLSNDHMPITSIHTFFSPDSWPKVHAYIKGETPPNEGFDDIVIVNKEGQKIPVRVFISNLQEDSTFQAYVFVISDISDIVESYTRLEKDAARISMLLDESHRLEQQVEVEKAGVEKTVEIRTKELRDAQVQLQESDKMKTEFIMLGSHNLRTPITIMASSLEMLKGTPADQDRTQILASLEEGIKRLKDFVEDMVAISTLEAGAGLIREPATAGSLLETVITEAKALAVTKPELTFSATVNDGDTVMINANSSRLQGAIRNVITNAFKFTHTGTIIVTAEKRDATYEIIVKDSGIGIEAEELPKIFTKFHRGTGVLTFEYEGKGIGLYLTKLIVEEHGGTVTAESSLGDGSTFTISLPIIPTA